MKKNHKVILNFLYGVREIEYKNFCRMIYLVYALHRKDFDEGYKFNEFYSPELNKDILDLALKGFILIKKKNDKFYISVRQTKKGKI